MHQNLCLSLTTFKEKYVMHRQPIIVTRSDICCLKHLPVYGCNEELYQGWIATYNKYRYGVSVVDMMLSGIDSNI